MIYFIKIKKGEKKTNKYTKCWEYFNCKTNIRENCPVYINHEDDSSFCDGWLYFNVNIGGPAKRGPCSKCEYNNKLYSKIFNSFVVNEKPIIKPKKYTCENCGKEFFSLSKILLKKEDKRLTCPYCESKFWEPSKTK